MDVCECLTANAITTTSKEYNRSILTMPPIIKMIQVPWNGNPATLTHIDVQRKCIPSHEEKRKPQNLQCPQIFIFSYISCPNSI